MMMKMRKWQWRKHPRREWYSYLSLFCYVFVLYLYICICEWWEWMTEAPWAGIPWYLGVSDSFHITADTTASLLLPVIIIIIDVITIIAIIDFIVIVIIKCSGGRHWVCLDFVAGWHLMATFQGRVLERCFNWKIIFGWNFLTLQFFKLFAPFPPSRSPP